MLCFIISLRKKATIIHRLAQKNLAVGNIHPNLQDLRNQLVSLSDHINSTVHALDHLPHPSALPLTSDLDSEATNAQSIPSDYDERDHLDSELERTLREMKKYVLIFGFKM